MMFCTHVASLTHTFCKSESIMGEKIMNLFYIIVKYNKK